jgi:hypothetical protein
MFIKKLSTLKNIYELNILFNFKINIYNNESLKYDTG